MPAVSEAITIDFNSLPAGPFVYFTQGDYQFSYIGFGDTQEVQAYAPGNNGLFDADPNNALGAEVIMSRIDAQPFSVLSFDLVNIGSGAACFWGSCLHFGGVSFGAGAEGTQAVNWLNNVGAFSFNIISSDFGAGVDWGIDNIVVEAAPPAVPEAGTMVLMLTGLAVAGRKRIAARFRR